MGKFITFVKYFLLWQKFLIQNNKTVSAFAVKNQSSLIYYFLIAKNVILSGTNMQIKSIRRNIAIYAAGPVNLR